MPLEASFNLPKWLQNFVGMKDRMQFVTALLNSLCNFSALQENQYR